MKNTFRKGIVETDGGVTPCSSTSVDENAIFIKKSWMEPFGCFMLMMLPSTGFIGTPLSVLFPVRSLYLSDFFCPGLQSRKYMKIRQMSGFSPLPPLCVVLFAVPNPWKNEGKQRKQTRQNLGLFYLSCGKDSQWPLHQKKSAWIPLAAVLQEAQERSTRSSVHPADDGVKVRCLTAWRQPQKKFSSAYEQSYAERKSKKLGWIVGFEPTLSSGATNLAL